MGPWTSKIKSLYKFVEERFSKLFVPLVMKIGKVVLNFQVLISRDYDEKPKIITYKNKTYPIY